MKLFKISAIILSAIIFLTATGCSNTVGDIEKPDTDETVNTYETKATTEQKEVDPITYRFFSAEDLHTYITTGSEDPADYPDSLYPLELESYPSPEHLKIGYLPIADLFDLDETTLDALSYLTIYSNSEIIRFTYNFAENGLDRAFVITIKYVREEQNIDNTNVQNNTLIYTDMAEKDKHDECLIQQTVNGTKFEYVTKYGVINKVIFEYGNYNINIHGLGLLRDDATKEDFETTYDRFMTLPETSAFAPFFSEDSTVRAQAFEKFETNFAAVKNEVK